MTDIRKTAEKVMSILLGLAQELERDRDVAGAGQFDAVVEDLSKVEVRLEQIEPYIPKLERAFPSLQPVFKEESVTIDRIEKRIRRVLEHADEPDHATLRQLFTDAERLADEVLRTKKGLDEAA